MTIRLIVKTLNLLIYKNKNNKKFIKRKININKDESLTIKLK